MEKNQFVRSGQLLDPSEGKLEIQLSELSNFVKVRDFEKGVITGWIGVSNDGQFVYDHQFFNVKEFTNH